MTGKPDPPIRPELEALMEEAKELHKALDDLAGSWHDEAQSSSVEVDALYHEKAFKQYHFYANAENVLARLRKEVMAAYQRGRAEERERCARIAEAHAGQVLTGVHKDAMSPAFGSEAAVWRAKQIAAAIRQEPT